MSVTKLHILHGDMATDVQQQLIGQHGIIDNICHFDIVLEISKYFVQSVSFMRAAPFTVCNTTTSEQLFRRMSVFIHHSRTEQDCLSVEGRLPVCRPPSRIIKKSAC